MTRILPTASFATVMAVAVSGPALPASEQELLSRIERLEAQLAEQAAQMETYRTLVEGYRQEVMASQGDLAERRAGQVGTGQDGSETAEAPPAPNDVEPVGEAPDTEAELGEDIEGVTALREVGGVLTPKNHFIFEPGIDYSHSDTDRFSFRGIELQEVVLIGVIEAREAKRDLISANATMRYGVTDRFELEARVPYVWRSDDLTFRIPVLGEEGDTVERSDSISGHGIGDIEFAGHYQLNGGRNGWPVFVGNVRLTAPTGRGPFEVDRDEFGVEQQLSTGSGFWSVEPSITAILPSDPAVLFGNLGYTFRFKNEVDERVGDFLIEEIEPGDGITGSVGMGFAVNEDLSFSLGYEHRYLMESDTHLLNTDTGETTTQESAPLHIGSAVFGLSYKLSDKVRVNLDFDFGVTEDAPDMQVSLRVPIQLGELF